MEKARIIYISVKTLASHAFSFGFLFIDNIVLFHSLLQSFGPVYNLIIERGNTLNGQLVSQSQFVVCMAVWPTEI